MGDADEKTGEHPAWRELSEAGLIEIHLDQFAERIRDVKRTVIVRLRELMEMNSGVQERESAAYSLGTLKRIESNLQSKAARPPNLSEK